MFLYFTIDCCRHWTDMSVLFMLPLILFAFAALILLDHTLIAGNIGRKVVVIAGIINNTGSTGFSVS